MLSPPLGLHRTPHSQFKTPPVGAVERHGGTEPCARAGGQQEHLGTVRDGSDESAHRQATAGVQEEALELLGRRMGGGKDVGMGGKPWVSTVDLLV